ncbi:hypothetical protein DPMN_177846 [Dreissena polymorpha]|uniref:Uncharacterized protein n=1 Tax=Dreissena polymorpha TaxID=45954 RepID=A0A9D4II57_DREPO|nr:hypothetical protein DPMN_177846 [Dreissena polymorpha]
MCLAYLGDFLAATQTVWESPAGAQTALVPSQPSVSLLLVPRRSWRRRSVSESPAGASPVKKTVWHRLRLSGSLLQVPRRSYRCSLLQVTRRFKHRRRSYRNLLHVHRRSGRLSATVADRLGVSCRCPDGIATVAACLGVSCRSLAGL